MIQELEAIQACSGMGGHRSKEGRAVAPNTDTDSEADLDNEPFYESESDVGPPVENQRPANKIHWSNALATNID
ncbi:hypothetical protein FRC11_008776 [Ceratobasidium sp. 423]|nr:hypothetical protein FRC11_008776 [Ceratobasidium sp. 423]